MLLVLAATTIEQKVQAPFDSHCCELMDLDLSQVRERTFPELNVSLVGFWRTMMFSVLLKPLVEKRGKSRVLWNGRGLALLIPADRFTESIGSLLAGIEAALGNLDSLSFWCASCKE